MKVSAVEHRFTDNEELDQPDYRPISRFAIAAVILSLLSWLALIHPLLLFVPILGAVASVTAYWQTASTETPKSGQAFTPWTLALCVLIVSWSVSASAFEKWKLSDQARTHSLHWLNLVREGKLHEAHQLTMAENQRIAAGGVLETHYAPRERPPMQPPPEQHSDTDPHTAERAMDMMMPTPHELFAQFFGQGYPKKLSELGASANYHFVRTQQVQNMGPSTKRIQQLIRVDYLEGGHSHRFEFIIVLERLLVENVAMWRVEALVPAGS